MVIVSARAATLPAVRARAAARDTMPRIPDQEMINPPRTVGGSIGLVAAMARSARIADVIRDGFVARWRDAVQTVLAAGVKRVGAAAVKLGLLAGNELELARNAHRPGARPGRSARDHLRWLARSNGIDRSRVASVLSLVGLDDVAGRHRAAPPSRR